MTSSSDRRRANKYTKLPGYIWFYTDYPNGDFVVFDRRGLGERWSYGQKIKSARKPGSYLLPV
jgi:hypothetical protein